MESPSDDRYSVKLDIQIDWPMPRRAGESAPRFFQWRWYRVLFHQDCQYLAGKHHEIYLSDIRRIDPAKWKTIIRQSMSWWPTSHSSGLTNNCACCRPLTSNVIKMCPVRWSGLSQFQNRILQADHWFWRSFPDWCPIESFYTGIHTQRIKVYVS